MGLKVEFEVDDIMQMKGAGMMLTCTGVGIRLKLIDRPGSWTRGAN